MLVFVIIIATFGLFIDGATGLFWGAVIGYAIGSVVKNSVAKNTAKSSQESQPIYRKPPIPPKPRIVDPSPVAKNYPGISVQINTGYPSRPTYGRGKPLSWIVPNQPWQIGNKHISNGMVYICEGQPNVFEPSAINLTLPIGIPATGLEAKLPYFPSYDILSQEQRGTYIDWLTAGRRDSDPQTREFGYLFLFFYGLERRVLVDEDFSVEIGNEIADLIRCYGSSGRSKSMPTYFSQLMHFWAFHQGPETYAELWPQILDVSNSVLGRDEFQMVLSSLANNKQNAPARVGREIAFNEPDAARSNIISRSPSEFRALFDKRFANEFPDGVPLRLGQKPVLARYAPASAALRGMAYNETGRFVVRTTYTSIDPSDRRRLINLWNLCCEDLTGYVRAKTRAADKGFDLATLIATPQEIRVKQIANLSPKFDALLACAVKDEEFQLISASAICTTFFGIPEHGKYSLLQSKQAAEGLECLGWSMEPDPRIHNAAISSNQEIALIKGVLPVTSDGFLGHCALVQMAATIGAADGGFDLRENQAISSLIDGASLLDVEKSRLRAWGILLGRNLKNAPTTIIKVAKAVPAEKCQAVAQMLCRVATADSIVTKNEDRALQRIFRCLSLSPETSAMLKKELDGFSEVRVTSDPNQPEAGEAIPRPPWRKYKEVSTNQSVSGQPDLKSSGISGNRLSLDQERIRKLSEETAEVIGILSAAMADTSVEAEKVSATSPKMFIAPSGPSWAEGLDGKFVLFAAKLAQRDTWSRIEFDTAATELKLMPGAAFDAINEWSDGALGDFLLEGEDPIHVNRHLIPA